MYINQKRCIQIIHSQSTPKKNTHKVHPKRTLTKYTQKVHSQSTPKKNTQKVHLKSTLTKYDQKML